MINFKLIAIDKITPIGQEPNLSLSWFWITEGDLWLTLGNEKIYEYSEEAITYFGNKETPYNDYYLVRFLEDFSKLFKKIGESLPEKIYNLTSDCELFKQNAQKWLEINDTDEEEYSDFYFEEYDKLVRWIYERTLDSGHLIGGPHILFFRCRDKIRIVWDTEHILENGISLWTAKDGNFEMDFSDFVAKVKDFGKNFFEEMEKQVQLVNEKDWGNVKIDKARIIEEHKERKIEFEEKFSFLMQQNEELTNWLEIEELFNRMKKEIN